MFDKHDLDRVKSDLQSNVGQKVRLTAKKGRKKSIVRQGVIESTYPSIFIVKLETADEYSMLDRRVSYSYIDVLTKSVELMMFGEGESMANVG